MAVITYLPGAEPAALAAADWPTVAPPERWRSRTLRALRPNEIKLLTLLALTGYVASGLWVRFDLHFWINDALNRSDDALYVTIGRDPHLGAIGFYWPPLPQFLEMPFMPFLRPFGEEILAGPLMTAVCMAATIPVLARLGRRLGLGRVTVFLVCLAFAITPDMVYTASNGMAESCFILSGAVTMLGFLTWIETHSINDQIVFSLGLAMLVMTRLEGPFIVVGLVAVAVLNLRHVKESLWQAAVLMLPPAFCYFLWVLAQYILLGDPLFFLHQNGGAAPAAGTNPILPAGIYHNPSIGLLWVLGWVAVLGPALFVVAASVVLRPLSRRTRGSVGILVSIAAVLAIQGYTAVEGGAFGDPRYFVMAVIFAVVGVLWLASPSAHGGGGRLSRLVLPKIGALWNLLLIALLIVGAGTGSYALTSGRVTRVEDECSYFQYGVARIVPSLGRAQYGAFGCGPPANGLLAWQQADQWIDTHLASRDRVLADNGSNYAAELYTTRPKLFIVRNDRDWAKTVANPSDVTYIITQSGSPTGPPTAGATYAPDEGAVLLGLDVPGWHLTRSFGGAENVVHQGSYVQLWHFVPSRDAGTSPKGTESAISG